MSILKLFSSIDLDFRPPLPEFNPNTKKTLSANDGSTGDLFGSSVKLSLDGNVLVIGAYGEDIETGSVYIFIKTGNGWSQVQKIQPAEISTGNRFGFAIAMNRTGSCIAISAPRFNNQSGRVWIYNRQGDTWVFNQTIDGYYSLGQTGNSLAMSIDGLFIIAGAPVSMTNAGVVYLFARENGIYVRQRIFQKNGSASGDFFGSDVAINADKTLIVIGMRGVNTNAGGVALYRLNSGNWGLESELYPTDPASNKRFGFKVSLNYTGDVLVVGADGDSQTVATSGAVYVFQKVSNTWSQKTKLKSPNLYTGGNFGYSIDINKISPIDYPEAESRIVIGAIGDDKSGLANSGTLYVWRFNGTNWVLEHTFAHTEENARSGYSVSISEAADKIVTGVAFGNGLSIDSGVAVVIG